jgi:Ca-activated chloride channel family protein
MPHSFEFHSRWVLWLLAGAPFFLAWAFVERRTRAVLRFSAAGVVAAQGRGLRPYLMPLLPVLRVLAIAFALIALARPQERNTRTRDHSVEGIDIMIALDLSNSMEAADFRPQNRLKVAKDVLSEFIDKRSNDRIGLVVFSGAAYTQAPLTLDYPVLKMIVSQLRTRILEDGTAIGDALATSLNRLRDSDAKSRVIVLITDGDNNAGQISPLDAAAMAKALHIPIYSILVGKSGKVPFPTGQDMFGNTVWREIENSINPELLQQISRETGGEYYRATDPQALREGLQKVLDSLERSKLLDGGATATYREDFHDWLVAAFILAALEMLLRVTLLKVFP